MSFDHLHVQIAFVNDVEHAVASTKIDPQRSDPAEFYRRAVEGCLRHVGLGAHDGCHAVGVGIVADRLQRRGQIADLPKADLSPDFTRHEFHWLSGVHLCGYSLNPS